MSNYSYPRYVRIRRALRRWVNGAANVLRAPVCRPEVLLVTGDAPKAKVTEIAARLDFILQTLDNKLAIRQARSASPLSYVRSAAVVAADEAAVPGFACRHLRWVANLDYDTNLADGWDLMDLAHAVSRGSRWKYLVGARRTFREHVRLLQAHGPRPVYLFGTGPSLELANARSFSDGISVVCNTIVRDPELWHHLAPSFLVAGDAIYHFGHTPHARAFRADALRRLKESDGRTLFVYPSRYDLVVRHEFAEVEHLLVPIPHGEHTDIAVDLTKRFCLPDLENVLANLLLPIGCTLSNDVRLWGFDGRGPTDSGFWANSGRHAYPELMPSIKAAHPAFFSKKIPRGKEAQYAKQVHGDLLDERLLEAEQRGYEFRMLHRSWTPTLQKRCVDSELFPLSGGDTGEID